jgi:hypothetical protein
MPNLSHKCLSGRVLTIWDMMILLIAGEFTDTTVCSADDAALLLFWSV